MIVVTTGSTMPFDELLQQVDNLAGEGFFADEVMCQRGQSSCHVHHCSSFIAMPTDEFAHLLARSTMVITHGGATVVQLLMAGKPFIAFPNPRGAGQHQAKFLQQLASLADISWSADVSDLARLYTERRAKGPATLRVDYPRAHEIILRAMT